MMKDEKIFIAILSAVEIFNSNIKLMILSTPKNEYFKKLAKKHNISLLFEAFADRNYNDDGSLVSRENENAVIHSIEEVKDRINILNNHGYIKSINEKELHLEVNTICVHSDNENSLEFIKNIRKLLNDKV